mmetsp:Transcript_10929/g.16108  ORF Transcript_10929/g.16108 Transcript_10929/m.16108 type:complete len:165 (+) Transcript_10929:83-577(+)
MKNKERMLKKACVQVNVPYIAPKANHTKTEDEERCIKLHNEIAKKRQRILFRARLKAKLKSSPFGRYILFYNRLLKQQRRYQNRHLIQSPDVVQSRTPSTPIPVVSSMFVPETYELARQTYPCCNSVSIQRPRRNYLSMSQVRPPTTTSLTTEDSRRIEQHFSH